MIFNDVWCQNLLPLWKVSYNKSMVQLQKPRCNCLMQRNIQEWSEYKNLNMQRQVVHKTYKDTQTFDHYLIQNSSISAIILIKLTTVLKFDLCMGQKFHTYRTPIPQVSLCCNKITSITLLSGTYLLHFWKVQCISTVIFEHNIVTNSL